MKKNYEQYAAYKGKQTELADMLRDSAAVIAKLNMNGYRDNLNNLSEKVNNDTFKIEVVGTFKNGKSTFINSFLGEDVLPAYALPCTAIINEVKWGEKKRAVIHFCDPLPEKLPVSLPQKAMAHMQAHGMKDIPPLEIPYDEIKDYAVIPVGKNLSEMLMESPYEKIELFWPLPLLKNGVEIIDSPGLNEAAVRTKVTMDYLAKADAIVMVFNALQPFSAEEMRFVENSLKAQGFTDPFFVVNRLNQIEPAQRQEIKDYAHVKLSQYSSNEILFISALDALQGKINNHAEQLQESGILEFEQELSEFLTKQKGKAKLAQPARELRRILGDEILYKTIPAQRAMLGSSIDEVVERYERAKPKLANLKTEKEQLKSKLMLRIEQARPEFRRAVLHSMTDLADCVSVWIDEFEPRTKIGVVPTKGKANEVLLEISDHIVRKIEDYQLNWRKTVLEPLVQERADLIFESVESDLNKLFEKLDSVNLELSGNSYEPQNIPVWQRVVGAAAGLWLGGPGGAFSGSVNGLSKELAVTAAVSMAAGTLLLMGMLNPVIFFGVLVIEFVVNWKRGQSNAMRRFKSAVEEKIIEQLENKSEDIADESAESICSVFRNVANDIVSALDVQINDCEDQVKAIIAEMEKGRDAIQEREKSLDDCENEIRRLDKQLDELIFQLVEG